MFKYLTSWIYVALLFVGSVSAYAGQATLAWNSPGEPGISGHRFYYGQSSRNYTSSIDVGNQTSYTDTGHQNGKTHYFATTTIGVSGGSEYSHPVNTVIPEIPPVANFSASLRTGTAPLNVSSSKPFNVMPVLFTSIGSVNDTDAVTTRLRDIGMTEFSMRMQEQEANKQVHAAETISYIAWEPSSGSLNGVSYEIGRTPDVVDNKCYTTYFQPGYQAPPEFLAYMQTRDGEIPQMCA